MSWLVVALVLILAALALPTVRLFPLEMAANLRPQIALGALLAGLCAVGLARYPAAAMLLVFSGALLARAPDLFRPAEPLVERPALTIVWCNIFKDAQVASRLAALATRTGADVVVVGEPTAEPSVLRTTLSEFPYVYGAEDPRQHGAVIFSRVPLESTSTSGAYRPRGYVTVSARLADEAGGLRIIALHPSVPGSPGRLKSRDDQILAAARAGASEAPALVIGDFNATPWTTAFRDLRRETKLKRLSPGLGSTWFSPWPFLGLPIDHALVTPGLRASVRVGPGLGSDHLPLIVRISPEARQELSTS